MRERTQGPVQTVLASLPRRGLLLTAAAILLPIAASGRPLGAPRQEPPVFSAAVDLVAVDVTVVDEQGRPISELQPQDFEVLVDGHARRIVSAQFLRHAQDPSGRPPAPQPEAVPAGPPAYTSNADNPPGRLIVLVPDIGNLSTSGGRGAAEAARRFLDRLTPADRVALVTIPVGPKVDFTSDHAKLRQALATVKGGSLDRLRGMRYVSLAEAFDFKTRADMRLWKTAISRECQFRSQLDMVGCVGDMEGEANQIYATVKANTSASVGALSGLMRGLARIDGPKTVILISQGLVTGSSMGQLGTDREMAPVAEEAAAARVTLYTILIDNAFLEQIHASERWAPATQREDQRLLADGLEAVTGYAGGQLYRVMVLADPGFDQIASETSGSWLLSIEPEAGDRDGKPHSLHVKVAREKTRVRSRPQFVAAPAPDPLTSQQLARRALDQPIDSAGIPIAVTTYVLGDREGTDPELVLAAELQIDPTTPGLELAWRALDEADHVVGGEVVQGPLNGLTSAAGVRSAYYSTSLSLKPGTYTLSLAAVDGTRRVGSVQHQVLAQFHAAGDVVLSDLMLAEPGRRAGSKPALNVDGTVVGRALRAYLEIRATGGPGVQAPVVRVEVAPAPSGGVDAPARLLRDAEVRAEAAEGRWSAEASLDLEALAPGEYVVRALALRDGSVAGTVTRPLRLVARP